MKYISYDFETTGLDWRTSQPIEIGIVKVDDAGTIEEYDVFVKTPEPLSDEVKQITKITDEMIAQSGIDIEVAMKRMFDIFGMRPDGYDRDVTIIGHNIIGFDNWFLKKYAQAYGYAFPDIECFYDTAGAFRGMLLGEQRYVHECDFDYHDRILRLDTKGARYNLTAACNYYGITMDKQAHRAHNDCLYTLKVFEKQRGITLLKYVAPKEEKKSEESAPVVMTVRHNEFGQGAFNF